MANALAKIGVETFQSARVFAVGTRPSSIALGDFNGDAIHDLVVAKKKRSPCFPHLLPFSKSSCRTFAKISPAQLYIEGFILRNGSVLVHGRRSSGIVLARNKFFGAQFYGVWFEQSPRGATQQVTANRFVDNAWGFYSLADWRFGDVYYEITGNTFPCIDAGVDVGLPFFGKAPDLGAFEHIYPRICANLREWKR